MTSGAISSPSKLCSMKVKICRISTGLYWIIHSYKICTGVLRTRWKSSKNLHSIRRHRKEIYTSFNLILMQYEVDWRHKRELFIYWFFNLNDVFSKAVLNLCYDSSNWLFVWKTNRIPRNIDFMRSVFANVIMIFHTSILVIICRDKNHLDPNCFVSAQEYVFQVLSG